MGFRFRSAALTDTGRVREGNEDAVLARNDVALWAVADGMGGLAHGDWASRTAIAALTHLDPRSAPGAMIGSAMTAANQAVFQAAQAAGAQMGTTLVALHLGREAHWLWVGDSRLYRFRRGRLEQLTEDHSVVAELVRRGSLTAADAETHPMAHVLSRALGTGAALDYETRSEMVLPGDVFLLCTDGLTRVVDDRAIERWLAGANPAVAARRLMDGALAAGAPDNVSVVVVAVEETTVIPGMTE